MSFYLVISEIVLNLVSDLKFQFSMKSNNNKPKLALQIAPG